MHIILNKIIQYKYSYISLNAIQFAAPLYIEEKNKFKNQRDITSLI